MGTKKVWDKSKLGNILWSDKFQNYLVRTSRKREEGGIYKDSNETCWLKNNGLKMLYFVYRIYGHVLLIFSED